MTDNEIKKALECCGIIHDCSECYLCDYRELGTGNCVNLILSEAFNLINRQRAEIEKLENDMCSKVVKCITSNVENARAEAIKEFAEKMKKRFYLSAGRCVVDVYHIDNIVKELTEVETNQRKEDEGK